MPPATPFQTFTGMVIRVTPLVFVIDDDPHALRFVRASLRANGFRVVIARDAQDVVFLAAIEPPRLVIVGVAACSAEGSATARLLRDRVRCPTLAIATASDDERVLATALNVDDALVKPFSVGELIARARAAIHRAWHSPPTEEPSAILHVGPLRIDQARRQVTVRGAEVALTRTEFELLRCLALDAGKVVTHRQLLERVWGPQYLDESNSLRTFIKQLRKKIEPQPHQPKHIITIPSVGYRLDDGQ
ncbi:MAG: response regulator transcription factor [Dehalococcoidia bacterium]|nr:response regulator transcription factor [Dehalococcoidia bacterium]